MVCPGFIRRGMMAVTTIIEPPVFIFAQGIIGVTAKHNRFVPGVVPCDSGINPLSIAVAVKIRTGLCRLVIFSVWIMIRIESYRDVAIHREYVFLIRIVGGV